MKVDVYTKVVLTVIAVCLTLLTLNNMNVFPKAFAAPAMSGAGSVPVNMDGSVNVKIVGIPYSGIPVEVTKFSNGTVPVEIKSAPYGGVPVKVQNSYIQVKQY